MSRRREALREPAARRCPATVIDGTLKWRRPGKPTTSSPGRSAGRCGWMTKRPPSLAGLYVQPRPRGGRTSSSLCIPLKNRRSGVEPMTGVLVDDHPAFPEVCKLIVGDVDEVGVVATRRPADRPSPSPRSSCPTPLTSMDLRMHDRSTSATRRSTTATPTAIITCPRRSSRTTSVFAAIGVARARSREPAEDDEVAGCRRREAPGSPCSARGIAARGSLPTLQAARDPASPPFPRSAKRPRRRVLGLRDPAGRGNADFATS